MEKVLITSIGNGMWSNEKKRYEYRNANYYIGTNECEVESPYIYDALTQLHGYDKLILIGTSGSRWGLLYKYLCDIHKLDPDLHYVDTLDALEKESLSAKMAFDAVEVRKKLEPLKLAFGEYCVDIIVLKYGLNDDEHAVNFELLTKIGDHIQDGDSLTFDITHSFRSLAIYELLAVSYIKETLCKNVTLDFVSYGMFEISRDNNGKTPIVDLSILVKMTDWLKAAEEYNRYGTTILLADLIESNNLGINLSKEERKSLKRLGSDAISINDLREFKNMVKNCINATKIINGIQRKNIVLDYIFNDIALRFGDKLDDDMFLQAELAKWHFEKRRYILAAVTLIEAILDYCATLTRLNKDIIRNRIRSASPTNSTVGNFLKMYNTIRKIRNKLAHAQFLEDDEIDKLNEYTKGFHTIYSRNFRKTPGNADLELVALRAANTEDLRKALLINDGASEEDDLDEK